MQCLAESFERSTTITAVVGGQAVSWGERQLIVRLLAQGASGSAALQRRVEQASAAIRALNERKRGKVRYTDKAKLQAATEALLQQHAVVGLLTVQYHEQVQECHMRKYRERPAETAAAPQRSPGYRGYRSHNLAPGLACVWYQLSSGRVDAGTSGVGLSGRIPGGTQLRALERQTVEFDADVSGG